MYLSHGKRVSLVVSGYGAAMSPYLFNKSKTTPIVHPYPLLLGSPVPGKPGFCALHCEAKKYFNNLFLILEKKKNII